MTLKQQSDIINGNFEYLDNNKQNKLIAGENINIDQETNTISASGVTEFSQLEGSPSDNTNLKNALDSKQNTLTAGTNIIIDPETNTISATGSLSEVNWGGIKGTLSNQTDLKNILDTKALDNKVVHNTGDENVGGVKTFTGGTGGSSTDVSLKTLNALAVGDETQTNYTGIYNHRKCSGDSNLVNTAGFLVNSDGSAKFTHKKGTTTAVGTADDSYIRFNQTTLVYSTSESSSDEKDILHTGNAYTKISIDNMLENKQETISDLEEIRTNASSAKSTIDTHVANSTIHVTANDKIAWSQKQNAISDLETIRSNAQTGANLAPQVEVNTQRIEDLTTSRIPDVIYHGTPKITGGQVSNFSTVNYLQFPFEDISRGLPFDIYFSFTTDDDVTNQQNIIDSHFGIALAIQNGKGVMALSSNGTNWDIGTSTGTNTILPNSTYYVKYSWTGTEYNTSISTNDQTYVPDMILASNKSPYKTTIYIGGSEGLFGTGTAHPFKGIINFTKSKVVVNGTTVWEGMADVGIASRANVSLSNLDEAGEQRFNVKANDNEVVHIAGNETIGGVKTFNGGKGGNDVSIISTNGMIIGGVDKTAYTQYGTIRQCDGRAHTGSYYINSDGSVLFRHKTGTATAEGSANDVMFTLHPINGIKAGWSGQYNVGVTETHDVLIDTINYSKLNTTAKDVLSAINELNTSKQTTLTAGENITIENNVISASGGLDAEIVAPLAIQEAQEGLDNVFIPTDAPDLFRNTRTAGDSVSPVIFGYSPSQGYNGFQCIPNADGKIDLSQYIHKSISKSDYNKKIRMASQTSHSMLIGKLEADGTFNSRLHFTNLNNNNSNILVREYNGETTVTPVSATKIQCTQTGEVGASNSISYGTYDPDSGAPYYAHIYAYVDVELGADDAGYLTVKLTSYYADGGVKATTTYTSPQTKLADLDVNHIIWATQKNNYYSLSQVGLYDGDTQVWNPSVQATDKSLILKYDETLGLNGDKLQVKAVIDNNNNAIKTWTGTLAEYNAISVKDEDTLYNITDDTTAISYEAYTKSETDSRLLDFFRTVYGVGSIFTGTMSVCPLAVLLPDTEWVLVAQDRVLQGAGTRGTVGTTIDESLPNITGSVRADKSAVGTGAFSTGAISYASKYLTGSDSSTDNGFIFDASLSSSTYQDGAPVQQNAYIVNHWERIK